MSHYEIVNTIELGSYDGWVLYEQESRCARTGRARFRFNARRSANKGDWFDDIVGKRTQSELEAAIDRWED